MQLAALSEAALGAAALADPAADTERLYGQIAIYTLLESGAAEFDRLASTVLEQVRTTEPDTLVFVVHGVPSAPLQRILYQVYRDRAAYDEHQRKSVRDRLRRPAAPAGAGHQRDRARRPGGEGVLAGVGAAGRAGAVTGRPASGRGRPGTGSPCCPGPAATCVTPPAR